MRPTRKQPKTNRLIAGSPAAGLVLRRGADPGHRGALAPEGVSFETQARRLRARLSHGVKLCLSIGNRHLPTLAEAESVPIPGARSGTPPFDMAHL